MINWFLHKGVGLKEPLLLLIFPLLLVGQAQVDSVLPSQNENNILPSVILSASFNSAMDSVTINDTTFIVMGSISGLHPGSVVYNNITRTAIIDPSDDFIFGEVVSAILTTGIFDSTGTRFDGFIWNFTIGVGQGIGKLTGPLYYSTDDGPFGIYSAKVNTDANIDLIVSNVASQDVSVLFGNGDGTFTPPTNYSIGFDVGMLVCGDIDGDSDNDVILALPENDLIYVGLNDGSGNFIPGGSSATGDNPFALFLSDLNNDGHLDVVSSNNWSEDFSVLLGNGDGTFQPAVHYGVGPDTRGIHGGDFDEDGDIDLAVLRSQNDRIRTFLNNGDGSFSSGGNFDTGSRPFSIYAASFNTADAHLDLTSVNMNSDDISVLLGNGDGTFGNSSEYQVSDSPVHLLSSDFDDDKDLDIIVSNMRSDTLSVLFNDGDGYFSSPDNYYAGDSIIMLCTGDFNNDGSIDIAVTCYNNDSVAVFLNRCDTVPPYIITTTPDSGQAGVPVNNDIFITLSEPMDTMSIDTSKFHVSGTSNPVYNYIISYDSLTNTVGLYPDSDFVFNETITVDVSSTIADTAGNEMISPYSFYFVVIDQVDSIGPRTSNTQVSPPNPPAGISQVVVYATVSDSTTGSSIINGAEAFLDSTGANGTGFVMTPIDGIFDEIEEGVFDTIPVSGWQAGESHTFYVHGCDAQGNWGTFDSATVYVIGYIDTIPPGVGLTFPDSGELDIPLNTWIYVTFTEPVDPMTVTSDKVLIDGHINGNYNFWMSYNNTDSTLSINPYNDFAPYESVDVYIASGIQDLAGNPMTSIYWWWFRTGPAPDTIPPAVSAIDVTPDTVQLAESVLLTGTLTDNQEVSNAEYFIDFIGSNGSGYAALPVDSFGLPAVDVFDTIYTDTMVLGTHMVYLHGLDASGNWGGVDSVFFVIGGNDTVGPIFNIIVDPSPAHIGDSVYISALPNEELNSDSAVVCSIWTASSALYILDLIPDTLGFGNWLSTAGFASGICRVKVSGYDVWLNNGCSETNVSISPQGEFMPREMVYAWPNPACGNSINFHFYVNANADVTVDIYNLEGKRVTSIQGRGEGGQPPHQGSSNAIVWNIPGIASDVYLFRIHAISDATGETRSVTKKFAIVK